MKFTKETLKRTIRTFIQALIAYFIVALPAIDFTVEKSALKSTLLVLGASALAAGLSAVMNLEKPEQLGGSSGMSFSEWVNKYNGKKTDYDGAYGVQCVDLIDCYIDKCLGLKKGFWGNAKEWWSNRNKSAWLKKNFDFVMPKYKNGELKKGDIGIRTSGTYGHIFIVAEVTADGKIKYYDQNADGKGAAMTLREKPYTKTYINGILRPKDRDNIDTAPMFSPGKTYTLTTAVKVREKAGINSRQLKRNELTADGQKNSVIGVYAVLKKGAKVTAQEVKELGNDIWIKIPSGWIAVFYNGDKYVK